MSDWKIVPLSEVPEDTTCHINKLPSSSELYKKLNNLGIRTYQEIYIVKGEKNNPYLLELENMQIFLDWEIIKKIKVKVNV